MRPRDPALLALVAVATLIAATTGFVTLAPNRLVSGVPVALAAAGMPATIALAGLGAALLAAAFAAPRRGLHLAVAVLAAAVLLLTLAAAGRAATLLAAGAPPLARIGLGPGFWALIGGAALAVVEALRRAEVGAGSRLAVAVALVAAFAVMARGGTFEALSLAREYAGRRDLFAGAVLRHLALVAGTIVPAVAIGVPLGLGTVRRPRLRGPVFAVLNLAQTVPSVALFGLLIVPLSALAAAVPALARLGIGGIGAMPALIALVTYALLPVTRNTAAGIAGVDPAVIDAGFGMGLTRRQILWQVELPLALPVLISGLRIVTVQTIGLVVVAALIGAGGLGTFVFQGLGQYATDLVLLGALPAIALALAADFALQTVAAALRHRGA